MALVVIISTFWVKIIVSNPDNFIYTYYPDFPPYPWHRYSLVVIIELFIVSFPTAVAPVLLHSLYPGVYLSP